MVKLVFKFKKLSGVSGISCIYNMIEKIYKSTVQAEKAQKGGSMNDDMHPETHRCMLA
jgi:hypothetical protein